MLDPTYRAPDPDPRPEPIFNVPSGILGVLAVMVGLHLLRQVIPDDWDDTLFLRLAFEPGTVTSWFAPSRVLDAVAALGRDGETGLRQAQFAQFVLDHYARQPWTALTYGLLHGGWAHVGVNALWLLAFGTPVARRLETWRFLVFLAAATLAGAGAQTLAHPFELQPMVGASAAVSGCMGAAMRFMFQPRVPVAALLGLAPPAPESAVPPTRPLGAVLRDRRALAFLCAWFLTNLLFGIGAMARDVAGGDVAWEAHIGGFLLGLFLLPWFERGRAAPPRAAGDPEEP